MKFFKLVVLIIVFISLLCTTISATTDLGFWEKGANAIKERREYNTVECKDIIYAIGGYNNLSKEGYLGTVEAYNPVTDSWEVKASMPTPRSNTGLVEAKGKVYVMGGNSDMGFQKAMEAYDPSTDTWITKASMPTERYNLGSAYVDGRIYAIGGYNATGKYQSIMEVYDLESDTWTQKASMAIPRNGFGVAEVGGEIYVIGGFNTNDRFLASVEVYNPKTDTWTTKASMPTKRTNLGVTVLDGKIYAIGGHNLTSSQLTIVEEYNPETDTWSTKASMPTGRQNVGVTAASGKVYAIGGLGDFGNLIGATTAVEIFTPTSDVQVSSPTNLRAVAEDDYIRLDWESVEGAESYTLYRSTTSGVIDLVIAENIMETTYVDRGVSKGIKYYYVVKAIKGELKSEDSNVAHAIIEKSENRAILLIYMANGIIKEYDLSMDKVNSFLSWYNSNENNVTENSFMFNKNYNVGPFISRKDYIVHNKITYFEVNEYSVR